VSESHASPLSFGSPQFAPLPKGKSPPQDIPDSTEAQEDSHLRLARSAGDLSVRMPNTRRSFVSVPVELLNWQITFPAGATDGSVEGELVSRKEAPTHLRERTLRVAGTLRITTEGTADKPEEVLGIEAGATMRWFQGKLQLRAHVIESAL